MLRTFIFSFFFFVNGVCYAQPVIVINNDIERMPIGGQVALLKDTTGLLSFDQIASPGFENRFIQNIQVPPSLGFTTYPVWCRFKIKNHTNQQLVLAIDNASIEKIDLYVQKNGVFRHKAISAYRPFHQREILSNKPFFRLEIAEDSTQVCYLRLQTDAGLQFPLMIYSLESLAEHEHNSAVRNGLYIGIMIIMMIYNLFIYFSTRDRSYLYYVLYVAFITLTNVIEKGFAFEFLWPSAPSLNHYVNITACLTGIFAILFAVEFLQISRHAKKIRPFFAILIGCFLITIVIILFRNRFLGLMLTEALSILATLSLLTAGFIVYKNGFKPAIYYLIAWGTLLLGVIIFLLKDFKLVPYTDFTINSLIIGSAVEAMLLSLALANRINIYKKEKETAQHEALLSLEENRKLIVEQNVLLEKKVEERTSALKKANADLTEALFNLKETQTQLIQREKVASLGELTAGIAHEIQNPLNFVNNFSETNIELIEEMKEGLATGNGHQAISIAEDIKENEKKINHHGKRADAIVKGMLQHSRASSGKKELTDINALANEYLRLSYHGLRAKDNNFTANFTTNLDESIGKIEVAPHDIGRVILNLCNNAFYAASLPSKGEAKTSGNKDIPTVLVKTSKISFNGSKRGGVSISVSDNGPGIPQKILDKIFQPFFTTKPAGQGTGLGLSLSNDIVKAHGGELMVQTKEGEGSEFIVELPV